jgi:predicted nuclease of predicted toxin-antitoxin system
MRLVADENLDLTVVGALREAGHEVFAVVEMEPGIPDEAVLGITNSQVAMLVTEDKDFGELGNGSPRLRTAICRSRIPP